MDLHEFKIGKGQRIAISVRHWAAALLLGEARRKSNERTRASHRDRGDEINIDNDLRGAFAELLLWRYLHKRDQDAAAYLAQRLLVNGASGADVPGPDARFTDSRGVLRGVDVKSHDCADYKQYYAINNAKHESLRGSCDAYWCLLAPSLARTVIVCDLVPYQDVDSWEKKQWKYDDEARGLLLEDFLSQFCKGFGLSALAYLRAEKNLYSMAEVRHAASDAEFQARLHEWLPMLDGLKA